MNNNVMDLCKKLKALADRGIGGEAINAARLLQKLLDKHGIKIEDLERPEKNRCEYDIMLRHQDLFWAIVFNVVEDFDGKYIKYRNSKRKIVLHLTKAEELEITAKFDFYVQAYEKQLQLFSKAFISKNRLYAKRTPEYEATLKQAKPLSEEELDILFGLMAGVHATPFQKRLANKPTGV